MDHFAVFDDEPAIVEKKECSHKSTCVDSKNVVCTDCGMMVDTVQTYEREWRYYDNDGKSNPTRCVARKTDGMIILKDLENTGIGEHVISLANEIYVQVTKGQIKRGKTRKDIIAACLFHAYMRLGTPKSCDMLRDIMKDSKLGKSDFLHGYKQVAMFSDKASGVHTAYITPVDIIKEIMLLLNASETHTENAVALYNKISPHSRMFSESRPQSVAAGIVLHYITNAEIKMSIKEFVQKVKISELTINKIRTEIKRIEKDCL